MPSPPAVITGRRLRQRLYRTRLHRRLGYTENKAGVLGTGKPSRQSLPREPSARENRSGNAPTSSGVISRPRKKKEKEERGKDRRAVSAILSRVSYGAGGGGTGWVVIIRHAVLRARTNRWRGGISRGGLRWLAKKKESDNAGRVEVRRARATKYTQMQRHGF